MPDGRRTVAWTLSRAARILPPAERQKLREFLFGLPGGEPTPKKRHSWKGGKAAKAKKRSARPARAKRKRKSLQLRLPLED